MINFHKLYEQRGTTYTKLELMAPMFLDPRQSPKDFTEEEVLNILKGPHGTFVGPRWIPEQTDNLWRIGSLLDPNARHHINFPFTAVNYLYKNGYIDALTYLVDTFHPEDEQRLLILTGDDERSISSFKRTVEYFMKKYPAQPVKFDIFICLVGIDHLVCEVYAKEKYDSKCFSGRSWFHTLLMTPNQQIWEKFRPCSPLRKFTDYDPFVLRKFEDTCPWIFSRIEELEQQTNIPETNTQETNTQQQSNTQQSNTQEPTTQEPTTQHSNTQEPTTQEPTTQQSNTEEPTTTKFCAGGYHKPGGGISCSHCRTYQEATTQFCAGGYHKRGQGISCSHCKSALSP